MEDCLPLTLFHNFYTWMSNFERTELTSALLSALKPETLVSKGDEIILDVVTGAEDERILVETGEEMTGVLLTVLHSPGVSLVVVTLDTGDPEISEKGNCGAADAKQAQARSTYT